MSIGNSSAAGAPQEPGTSPTGSRRTSASNIVSCSAHRSLTAEPQHNNSVEAATSHQRPFSGPGQAASTPKAGLDVLLRKGSTPACASALHTQDDYDWTLVKEHQNISEDSSCVHTSDGGVQLIDLRSSSKSGCVASQAIIPGTCVDAVAGRACAGLGEAAATKTALVLSTSCLLEEYARNCVVAAGESAHSDEVQRTGDECLVREDLHGGQEQVTSATAAHDAACSVAHKFESSIGANVSVHRDGRMEASVFAGGAEAESTTVPNTGFCRCIHTMQSMDSKLAGISIKLEQDVNGHASYVLNPAPEARRSLSGCAGYTRTLAGPPADDSAEAFATEQGEMSEEPSYDGREGFVEQGSPDIDADQTTIWSKPLKVDVDNIKAITSANVHSSPRIQAASAGSTSGGQSPARKFEALQAPISPRGLTAPLTTDLLTITSALVYSDLVLPMHVVRNHGSQPLHVTLADIHDVHIGTDQDA